MIKKNNDIISLLCGIGVKERNAIHNDINVLFYHFNVD